MLTRPYEMPWRRAYEFAAAAAWTLAAIQLFSTAAEVPAARGLTLMLAMACAILALRRYVQGWRIVRLRAALGGRAIELISFDRVTMLHGPTDQVFIGMGFDWLPVHAQRLRELSKLDPRKLAPHAWTTRWLHATRPPQPDAEIGLPYIHGLEPRERPLRRPLQNFEGGTLLVGTTQAGKGVALAHLIVQAVRRGDVVIVVDPKNSHRLRRVTECACETFREPGCFLEFHPAFPERGVRLDFTFNWQKPTEIASRIQSILPADTGGAFSAFGWDAVNVVVQGLVALEERPNLSKLTRYIEGGVEPLLEPLLRRYFERQLGIDWRTDPQMTRLFQDARRGNIRRPSEAASADLIAMVSYYEHFIAPAWRDKIIDAQVRVFRHNREHYQKITANLLPLLSMLTSGDLGRTLSPDPFDAEDQRPMMNLEKIERGRHVLYMCLDSLPDPSVAHSHRRTGAGRPRSACGHALQPRAVPAHCAVRR